LKAIICLVFGKCAECRVEMVLLSKYLEFSDTDLLGFPMLRKVVAAPVVRPGT
jgi:hypothetical protein